MNKTPESDRLNSTTTEERLLKTQVPGPRPDASCLEDSSRSISRGMLIFYAGLLCVVAIGYSFYTNHIWEDSLITLRAGENLVDGNGLSYHAGARVHTFTSPINVLMLALCYLLTGKASYLATIWLYRVFSIAAFAGSGVLLLLAVARTAPQWMPALCWFAIVYLFDAKSVAYSTNGMETAYLLLFLAWAMYLLSPPQPGRWLARGLCWAGLMWSRPDGCVYVGALALAEFFFNGSPWRPMIKSLAKSGAICALVYSPWFIWAWSYYGSPIPNTVVAKSNPLGMMAQFWIVVNHFLELLFRNTALVFGPIYSNLGPLLENQAAQRLVDGLTQCLGIFCAAYWLFPVKDRLGRIASFSFATICFYFGFQFFVAPWYLPPAALLGLTALGRAFATLGHALRQKASLQNRRLLQALPLALLIGLAVAQIGLFGLTTWEMKIQQAEIEMGTRAQVGLWLRDHGQPSDTVYLEPLGYIGYFCKMKMHDFPGLVSPDVVHLVRENKSSQLDLIMELQPNWVILRPNESKSILDSPTGEVFQKEYACVKTFDAAPRLEQYGFIPGKAYLYYDSQFGVFHRKTATPIP